MATVAWPPADKRTLIGKRIDRLDGPAKATGAAKYTYDINRPGLLFCKLLTSPYAHAEIGGIDTSAAAGMPRVKAVWKDEELNEVQYVGQIVAAVAAETEEAANEAVRRIKVEWKPLPHQVVDSDPKFFDDAKNRPGKRDVGNVEEALAKADVVSQGEYGIAVITHCCLEPHGQVAEMRDGDLYLWASTQAVSGVANGLGEKLDGFPQNKIHVDCQYMGGGFGSKFNYDKWGVISAALSKQTGQPVKLMLERDTELMIAGNRPSAFAKIKVGAQKDGTVTAFDAEVWGTSGMGGGIPDQVPYVFGKIPNQRRVARRIQTHRGGARAWRAPNHPQLAVLTMSALADTAAALKMDELEFFLKNVALTDRPEVYFEELKIAAEMIGYNQKKHLRGDQTPGPIKRGLGMSIHTWGGRGHDSECDVTISPDGSVEAKLGSQDLGTGNRTVIGIVVAETLGLPLEAVKVQIGKNEYPNSGGSGGSTTVGGVSVSSRQAATAALNALFDIVAPKLGVAADALEASNGQIRQIDKPDNKISWKSACAMLGVNSLTKRGASKPGEAQQQKLMDAGVGGAQIADVSVDIETGIVTMNEMVAVQDCGLIIDLKTAESQVYGGLIMGITYALFEEAVYDPTTGRMLNADMEFYRLAGIKDVGQLKVHMMTTKAYEDRGVIGLGEPPVISPGAAIANAVANAVGVRVPNLPLTPDRVIAALQKGGALA
ncbi:MAG TPA: xanthine dehydrogenase family protein molybdopterin-binding subunit [Candidatus Eisenbacteria bacterium]|jgi:xanthine dehydrogenase YagR molybdenum-binding subunit|nr:xanthine dehydrogenase family protein molybdopterin-binding subunit [Candidatus Eisenbacteria bacterium]